MESIVMLMRLTIWVIIGVMFSLVVVYIWLLGRGTKESSTYTNANTDLNDNFSENELYNQEDDEGPIKHL